MEISSFKGIHNVQPARAIPNEALADAVDCNLTDTGDVLVRPGYDLALVIAVDTAYTTKDLTTYAVSAGNLYRITADLDTMDLGTTTATEFCDEQRYLFTNSGQVIYDDKVHSIKVEKPMTAPDVFTNTGDKRFVAISTYINADGLESPVSPSVTFKSNGDYSIVPAQKDGFTATVYVTEEGGEVFYDGNRKPLIPELMKATDSFPDRARKIELFDSRLFVTEEFEGYTVVWFSIQYQWHLYDRVNDYFVIPGRIEDMKSTSQGLIMGTLKEIYAYDGTSLTKLADYGIVPGRSIVHEQASDTVLIHTQRGICRALTFAPLTEKKVSLPVGNVCSTSIMNISGMNLMVALHDGGTAFNKF